MTSSSNNNNSKNITNNKNNNNSPATNTHNILTKTTKNLTPTPSPSGSSRAAASAATTSTVSNLNTILHIANGASSPNSTTTAAGIATGLVGTAATSAAAVASRTMQSDEDFNIRFVNLVRQHRCLYDKKVPEYRNRDNQEKSWSLISQETRESVIHCKERWRNLRACLSRYIKQQSGNDPQHKPYYLTEHMAFLLPFLKSTRNSLDGNNSLAQLYQFSQQQQQLQNDSLHLLTQTNLAHFGASSQEQQQNLELKHSLSENDDEETIDAFDPAVTATLQLQQQQHQLQHSTQHSSAPLSDTASANSLQNFIPDVQLSEFQTSDADCAGREHLGFTNGIEQQQQQQHTHHGVTMVRRGSHDFGGQHQPVKRIKTECHASEATTTQAQLAMYNCDNSDMEFFRSILPDIAALTPQQKRKFKIGILELIDDVIERYPVDRQNTSATNVSTNSIGSSHGSKQRRHSGTRDWRR